MVHFRDFPADKILKCNTREAAEKMYMHTLKQALFVLQGNTRSFNAMVLEQQQMLWEASNSGSGGLLESVAADLRGCEVTKSVPVRVFYKKRNEEIDAHDIPIKCDVDISRINDGDNLKLQNNASTTVCYQRPVQIFNAQKGGVETLLLDVLVQYLPNIFPYKMTSPQRPTVLVHGIDVPLNTPILQLWKSCAHADFFLYIIVLN